MAFQNLRTGSTVYAFYQTESPKFEIGQLMEEPELSDKYPVPNQNGQMYPMPMYQQPPQQKEQVVKLVIKFGDKIQPIERINANLDIQDCGNGLILSCNRDAMNARIIAYKQISERALDERTLETHRNIYKACEEALTALNPEIAERQRLEEENEKLRAELQQIRNETSEMKGMMSELLQQLGGSSSGKQKH